MTIWDMLVGVSVLVLLIASRGTTRTVIMVIIGSVLVLRLAYLAYLVFSGTTLP